MSGYMISGLIGGVVFYLIKLGGFYAFTHPSWMRWLRTIFHSGPVGLFFLDIIAGYVIMHAISLTSAGGVTVLFIFIGFSLTSALYIAIYLTCRKTKQVAKHCIGGFI